MLIRWGKAMIKPSNHREMAQFWVRWWRYLTWKTWAIGRRNLFLSMFYICAYFVQLCFSDHQIYTSHWISELAGWGYRNLFFLGKSCGDWELKRIQSKTNLDMSPFTISYLEASETKKEINVWEALFLKKWPIPISHLGYGIWLPIWFFWETSCRFSEKAFSWNKA